MPADRLALALSTSVPVVQKAAALHPLASWQNHDVPDRDGDKSVLIVAVDARCCLPVEDGGGDIVVVEVAERAGKGPRLPAPKATAVLLSLLSPVRAASATLLSPIAMAVLVSLLSGISRLLEKRSQRVCAS